MAPDDQAGLAVARPGASLLSEAIEVSQVSVTIADMSVSDGPLCFANTAFLRATGYSHGEVVGRNCRFLQGPDTDPNAVMAMRRAIAAGEPLEIDILNYRKCGEPFWNNLHLSPVFDPHGQLSAFIGIQHDVTEQRAAREAEAHRQRVEALGRMASGLAHELNNMLQPLITLPDLVSDALPASAQDAREDLAFMLASARDARDLVADMLVYTRIKPGSESVLDAEQAVRSALSLAERTLHGAVGVRLTVDAPRGVKIANLTQGNLQQILINLILNGAQAMNGRGDVVIDLGVAPDGGARLSVSDRGCGMDDTVKARLFEPFFTTKPIGEGAGLGLHIVRDLVRHAGGEIEVTSTLGEGSTFTLKFPPTASAT